MTPAALTPARRAPLHKSLFAQVVAGLVLGIALGVLAPLGYGVFTAVGAALVLGAIAAPHTVVASEGVTDSKPEAAYPY